MPIAPTRALSRQRDGFWMIDAIDPTLVLFLPLYHEDLMGSPFTSKDIYGHLCTVIGALWTPQGRYFDGSDDVITIPDHAVLQPARGTIFIWFKTDEINSNEAILSKTLDSSHRLAIWVQNNSVNALIYNGGAPNNVLITASNKISANTWFLITFTFGAPTGAELFVDNVSIGTSAVTTGMDIITSGDLLLMKYSTSFQKGYVGELILYTQVFKPPQNSHLSLATKWRYIRPVPLRTSAVVR